VLDLLDWTDNIATGSPNAEILSPVVPRLQKVIRFTDRFMSENNNILTAYDASEGSLYTYSVKRYLLILINLRLF